MRYLLSLCLAAAALSAPAQAALITTLPGTAISWVPSGTTPTAEPAAGSRLVDGFLVSWNGPAGIDYNGSWGFDANGRWTTLSLLGDNNTDTMITIDLGGNFATAGGWFNYARFSNGATYGTPILEVLDSSHNVLESHNLSVDAPIIGSSSDRDQGAFRAITLASPDIRYLRFGGSYLALHSWTVDGASSGPSPVPEPATLSLAAGALLLFAGLRLRR